jgi:hypothetical protein
VNEYNAITTTKTNGKKNQMEENAKKKTGTS